MDNSKMVKNVFAAFFANELLVHILPTFETQEKFLKNYRENIDNYCVLITAFSESFSEGYEILVQKLLNYYNNKNIRFDRGKMEHVVCELFCTPSLMQKLSASDKKSLFKKFIHECVKIYTTQTLVISESYTNTFGTDNCKTFKINTLKQFEHSLETIIGKFSMEISSCQKGVDYNLLQNINNETTIVKELRMQNDELRYKIRQLEEEINRLKINNIQHEKFVPSDDEESN
jgi:hypothetical protein